MLTTFGCVSTFQPYKRVGGQKHSADTGRGLIGVADVTELMVYFSSSWLYYTVFSAVKFSCPDGIKLPFFLQDEDDGKSLVLNNKQGFTDCEIYAKLEEWLGRKVDDYWDTNYDNLEVVSIEDFVYTGKHL
jgi:hypothetical protein